ncbi:MAG TPA: hypothetical protein VMB79_00720 [Jatrophihabitans sp.]|nr:hypothetical protein [Jatrophihabitans sp.]
MTELPSWSHTGVVPIENDLSGLEAALHAGRVSAAERGYAGEPAIGTEEVMLAGTPAEGAAEVYVTAAEAEQSGLAFTPTHLRYRLDWAAEG